MRKVIKLAEAAERTGLSAWELRQGARAGKYPHLRTGGQRGTILFDLALLEEAITRQMLANSTPYISAHSGGIRPVPVDTAPQPNRRQSAAGSL